MGGTTCLLLSCTLSISCQKAALIITRKYPVHPGTTLGWVVMGNNVVTVLESRFWEGSSFSWDCSVTGVIHTHEQSHLEEPVVVDIC